MHIERPSGTHFPSPLYGEILSDREKLVGEYVFGVDEATSIINRADPDNPLTVVGAPVYGAAGVTLKSHLTDPAASGFETGIVLHMEGTQLIVREHAAIASTGYIFAPKGIAHAGFGQWATNQRAAFVMNATNKGAFWARGDIAVGVPYFEAAVYPEPGELGIGYHSDGGVLISETAKVLGGADAPSSNIPYQEGAELSIGGLLSDSITTNTYVVRYAAIYQKPLTPDQVATAYAEIKAWLLAERGVTVE